MSPVPPRTLRLRRLLFRKSVTISSKSAPKFIIFFATNQAFRGLIAIMLVLWDLLPKNYPTYHWRKLAFQK